jgi:hypothetical protein
MSPDPKWLEILKASGGQSASLAVACAAFLVLTWLRWIPEPYPWMIHASVFVLVLSGMLTITSFGTAFLKSIPIHKWAVRSFHERRAARELEKYLDHLTVEERKILTYLLHHNQKMFTGAADGGHAVTLISRGFVVRAMNPGQQASAEDVPYAIPDHVWDMLIRNKERFPYKPPPKGEVERDPWRVHWMLR